MSMLSLYKTNTENAKKNAEIDCKFHLAGDCKAGRKCAFKHGSKKKSKKSKDSSATPKQKKQRVKWQCLRGDIKNSKNNGLRKEKQKCYVHANKVIDKNDNNVFPRYIFPNKKRCKKSLSRNIADSSIELHNRFIALSDIPLNCSNDMYTKSPTKPVRIKLNNSGKVDKSCAVQNRSRDVVEACKLHMGVAGDTPSKIAPLGGTDSTPCKNMPTGGTSSRVYGNKVPPGGTKHQKMILNHVAA
jgi:hypothetical protein